MHQYYQFDEGRAVAVDFYHFVDLQLDVVSPVFGFGFAEFLLQHHLRN